MRLRSVSAGLALTMAASLGTAAVSTSTASAESPTASVAAAPSTGSITAQIPCTIAGLPSTCALTVTGFQVIDGVLNAVGTVTGGNVSIPFQVPVQASGSCRILDLTLGPLHLDLLGLVVDLNQVHLTITAEQGPGNLLGNLLCAVANLLNQNTTGSALDQLARLLNRILGAIG